MNKAMTMEQKESISSIDKLLEKGIVTKRTSPLKSTHPFYSKAYKIDRDEIREQKK